VSAASALVAVVDDDESVRESLPDLVRALGFEVRAFASAEDFLGSDCLDTTQCMLLDIAMPGMSGPELQQELARRGKAIPIIFITAHADAGVRPQVLARGAITCLVKPFSEDELVEALDDALG
jgi:FixJ family two-component response regulator